jgi:hypothetical protein
VCRGQGRQVEPNAPLADALAWDDARLDSAPQAGARDAENSASIFRASEFCRCCTSKRIDSHGQRSNLLSQRRDFATGSAHFR